MKSNKKIFSLLFLAGIIILFNACKTSRQTTASVALTKMNNLERIESIKYQATSFNTLSSSLRFSMKPGTDKSATSANAQLRIIKDKAIQLSVRMPILGEVARIAITPEQILFINRLQRQYVSENIQSLKKITEFDFDFYSLQALLTNQLFIAGKQSVFQDNYSNFILSEDEFFVKLNNKDSQGINYIFTSDFTNRIIKTEMYKNKDEANLNWVYNDFGLTSNNRLFPMKMTMEVTVPKNVMTLDMTFNNVDIDAAFEIDTSIPNNYQPVALEQIIKLLQSL